MYLAGIIGLAIFQAGTSEKLRAQVFVNIDRAPESAIFSTSNRELFLNSGCVYLFPLHLEYYGALVFSSQIADEWRK